MDETSPPASPEPSETMSSPPSSPIVEDTRQSKKKRKKRKIAEETQKRKKPRSGKEKKESKKLQSSAAANESQLTASQAQTSDQLKGALEEDPYSAFGSVVDTDDSDDDSWQEDHPDRQAILSAWRKQSWLQDKKKAGRKKKRKRGKRRDELNQHDGAADDGLIFPSTGGSNATWVQCDKCKKWRRLRGVVDANKLPSKWYCSMNRNDPERSRCSAPEEEYDSSPPEDATEQRIRKHLRLWVRRLQGHEAYEGRPQPTMTTRHKNKRNSSQSRETPYEWVRCCSPSCGKWRALLKCMDAKTHVIDPCTDGKWYCVMNSWDEKTASCAAPQENLPALGCPPWVLRDNKS